MKNIIYTSENGDNYTWSDFVEAAKGNMNYAHSIKDRITWQSLYTVVDEDLNQNEIIAYNDKYYMTGGQCDDIIIDDAKIFYNDAFEQWNNGNRVGIPKIGGYWCENNTWVAFNNRGGEMTRDDFSDKNEAIKYAKGIEVTTKDGYSI